MKPIVDEAVRRLQLKAEVKLVCYPAEIKQQGIQQQPALMVNGQIVVQGKVPSIFTMPDILQNALHETQT